LTVIAVGVAAAPLAFAVLVIGLRSPTHRLLPAYAALLPFGSGLALPLGLPVQYTSLSSLTGFALIASLAYGLLVRGTARRPVPATAALWTLLFGLFVLSTLWSITPRETVATVISVAGVMVLFVLLAFTPIDRTTVARTELWLVLGGVAACCYGLFQAVTGTLPADTVGNAGRFGSDLIGDNHIAGALLIPLAVALAKLADHPSVRVRVAHALAVLMLMTGILLSGSRGGLIGAAVTFVIVLLIARRRTVLIAICAVAVTSMIVVLSLNPGGIGERQASLDDSGRADIWRVGMQGCETYCVTGSGWGTFPEVYERTQSFVAEAKVLVRGARYVPHNNWLLLGVELGIAGLVLLNLGFALAIRDALLLPRAVRAGPLAALVAVLSTGILLSNFEFKYFWFALTFVLLVSLAQEQPDQRAPGAAPLDAPPVPTPDPRASPDRLVGGTV
jgi:hypothetical protein